TDAEAWLDQLADDPTATAENASDLRAIAAAVRAVSDSTAQLDDAVAAARAHGQSWGAIGAGLGVSKHAAREPDRHPDSPEEPGPPRRQPRPARPRQPSRLRPGRLPMVLHAPVPTVEDELLAEAIVFLIAELDRRSTSSRAAVSRGRQRGPCAPR